MQSTQERWQIVFIPMPRYLLGAIGLWTWMMLAAGLTVTVLIGFIIFQQAQQGLVISETVEEQTQALRDSANRLKAVFDTVLDGLITINSRGIPESFRNKIFDKFSQADSSSARSNGGTGLGLHITKSIIEALGGTISFDTEEGKGTPFHFILPTCKPKECI